MYVKLIKNGVGVLLVILGIAGIFLPIIPGILLLLAGFFFLGIKTDKIKKWFKRIRF